jgi:hypothetical protein
MATVNARGNYRFIPAGSPFSAGCAADPGFAIVHAVVAPMVPLQRGFALVESQLTQAARPIAALCAMQLRLPAVLSAQGFAAFNQPYIERLRAWGLDAGGANPVARTNVALELKPVPEPMLAGFFFTVPSASNRPSIVISGAAETRSGPSGGREIVAQGDTSRAGLKAKAECILQELSRRLAELGSGWDTMTAVNVYTVHDIHSMMPDTLLPAIGQAAHRGIHWHYARPPVVDLDLEIDTYAVNQEIVIG